MNIHINLIKQIYFYISIKENKDKILEKVWREIVKYDFTAHNGIEITDKGFRVIYLDDDIRIENDINYERK